VSDQPVDPDADPEGEHEFQRPEEEPPEVAEAWEEEDGMEGEAPSG
jgi:hypothetical protein